MPIMEVRLISREGKSKAGFRKELLSRVRDLSRHTKESMEKAQARYKAVYDAHVREKIAKDCPWRLGHGQNVHWTLEDSHQTLTNGRNLSRGCKDGALVQSQDGAATRAGT
jgi:RNase P subunit RPR2